MGLLRRYHLRRCFLAMNTDGVGYFVADSSAGALS